MLLGVRRVVQSHPSFSRVAEFVCLACRASWNHSSGTCLLSSGVTSRSAVCRKRLKLSLPRLCCPFRDHYFLRGPRIPPSPRSPRPSFRCRIRRAHWDLNYRLGKHSHPQCLDCCSKSLVHRNSQPFDSHFRSCVGFGRVATNGSDCQRVPTKSHHSQCCLCSCTCEGPTS